MTDTAAELAADPLEPIFDPAYTFGLTRDEYRERLIYGVRRVAQAVRQQQHSGAWLSLVEIEALLSLIPDMSPIPDIPQTARRD